MNYVDLDHTILQHINQQAKALEKELKTDVISYFGQIHPGLFRTFRNFIEEVKSKSNEQKALSIVLRTPGGSVETAEKMVGVIRQHYETVNFIVPDIAMSAGTILCMSGDRIFMDYSSSLGPVDPQVMASDGSGYIAALGYLDKVEELTQKESLGEADVVLLRGLDLGKLALFEQAKNLSIELLKTWLIQYKFKDWTVHRTTNKGAPVTSEQKEARAEEIARDLSDHKKWLSHGRSLTIDKLKKLRLDIDDYSGDDGLRMAIRGYNDLLSAYIDRANLPFYMHSHHLTEA